MQRLCWWFVVLACAGSALSSTAHAQRVGTFKSLDGAVWIDRQGHYVHPQRGDGWLPGDRLYTGVDGSALLNLRNGTLLTLAHSEQLEFDRLELNEEVQRRAQTNQPPVVYSGDAQRGQGCSGQRLYYPNHTRLVDMTVDFTVIGLTDRVGATMALLGFATDRTQAFGMGERRSIVPTEDEVPESKTRHVELVAR